jgi:hypothetical protein
MSPTTALEVKRVPHSEELLHPGEFCTIPKREPIVLMNMEPVQPPQGLFSRLIWRFFGEEYVTTKTVIPQRPDVDTVIVNCPLCNGPVGTTKNHLRKAITPLSRRLVTTAFFVLLV